MKPATCLLCALLSLCLPLLSWTAALSSHEACFLLTSVLEWQTNFSKHASYSPLRRGFTNQQHSPLHSSC
ncbi:semaphorin-4F isoform X1 [Tachysurus ichikawai]